MFPILQLGPLAIQLPGLFLLAGIWFATWLIDREAPRHRVPGAALNTLVFYGLIAGIIGARLAYVSRYLCCCGRPIRDEAKRGAVVDWEICQACEPCFARSACQTRALVQVDADGPALIDLARCHGCGDCLPACPYSAISLLSLVVPGIGRSQDRTC